jgi:hypothetical protein
MTQSTLKFWNSVAKIYDQSELTTHNSDAEMDFVLKLLSKIPGLNRLVCLGVADGCRDPYLLLEFLKKNNKALPATNIFNDYSPELLTKCWHRIREHFTTLEPVYLPVSILNIDHTKYQTTKSKNNIIIGLYNFDYIMESLKIYQSEQKVIGNAFELTHVFFDGTNLFKKGDSIKFCIDDSADFSHQILNPENSSMSEIQSTSDTQFVGCCVSTNTGFVSHYYHINGLEKVINNVFGNAMFKSIAKHGNRYILTHIVYDQEISSEESYENNSLTTCLNNVIGNIPTDQQLDALLKMKQLNE